MRLFGSALLLSAATMLRAQGTVRGKVFDTYTHAPLADVSVMIGSGSPVVTDRDGGFSFSCSEKAPVSVRKLGYESYASTVKSCAEPLQIGLTPGAQNLNEVNVITTREAPNLRQPQSVSTLSRPELTRGTALPPFAKSTIGVASVI